MSFKFGHTRKFLVETAIPRALKALISTKKDQRGDVNSKK